MAPISLFAKTRAISYCDDVSNSSAITEAEILNEVIVPNERGLSAEAARSILALRFSSNAQERIRRLLAANNSGIISAAERSELEKYLRVGQFLDLLQAKARLSLQESNGS